MKRLIEWFVRWAFPREFRERFGDDLVRATRSRAGEIRERKGAVAALAYWIAATADVVRAAWAERRDGSGASQSRDGLGHRVRREIRDAGRSLARQPGTTAMAVAAIAVGIGLATTAFSIVYGSVLRGLPFERAGELVHFERSNAETGQASMAVTPHDFVAWRGAQQSFEDLGAYVEAVVHLTGADGAADRLIGVHIDAASFGLLRVSAALGRTFSADDDTPGASPVILLSDAVWRTRFGADSSLIGETIRANGEATTVIGVMPPGFGFPIAEQFWLPLRLDLSRYERGSGRLDVFGRLGDGVSLDQAIDEFAVISRRLQTTFPENRGISADLRTFEAEYVGEEFRTQVMGLLVAAMLVLVVSCANVASLLIVRASRRTREMAMRTALGATRSRVVLHFLVESTLLAGAGGIVGVALAATALRWFDAVWAGSGAFPLPHGSDALFWWQFSLDLVPIAFAVGLTLVAAAAAGAVPAWRGSSAAPADILKDGARDSGRRRRGRSIRALVIAELTLATGLLVPAGLTLQSVAKLRGIDDGFTTAGVVTARIALPGGAADRTARYDGHASRLVFWEDALDALRAHPAVADVAFTNHLPVTRAVRANLSFPGRTETVDDAMTVRVAHISPGFLELLEVAAATGRLFDERDRAGSEPVALVNESFVQRHFPEANPISQRIRIGGRDTAEPVAIVVGVVPDLFMDGDRDQEREGVYLPLAQSGTPDPSERLGRWGLRYGTVALRMRDASYPVEHAVRTTVASVDPAVPAYGIESLSDVVATRTGRFRFFSVFYTTFGAVALFLACLGLFAVISLWVAARTGEIGIRMALGSSGSAVAGNVFRQAAWPVGIGLAAGVTVAWWLARGMTRVLYQVAVDDPAAYVAIALVFLATAGAACSIPARRAAKVDPLTAIRG